MIAPLFEMYFISRGSGKGDIVPITTLEMAYKEAESRIILTQRLYSF